jgi:hypothetical protein
MTPRLKGCLICLLLILSALLLSACSAPQYQSDQLQSDLTTAQKQLGELNTRVDDLTKTNSELESSLGNATKVGEGLKNSLTDAAKLNQELSTIAAYSLWYDGYYGAGVYSYNDTSAFNAQLGNLIAAMDDANSRTAFDIYHATDYDYNVLVASLPADNVWTESEYAAWRAAGETRKEALGQVGVHLLRKLEAVPWFEGK